jgi:hypothetical protein
MIKPIPSFTRRDFLKLSASGALGLFLAETGLDRALAITEPPAGHGRVLMNGLIMYKTPSFGSEKWTAFGKDQTVPISEVVEGDAGNPFNTAWYRIGEEGFTYSGWLQPVETNYNKAVFDTHAEGQVGEITVPFSLARLQPDTFYKGLRLYYQTTHWKAFGMKSTTFLSTNLTMSPAMTCASFLTMNLLPFRQMFPKP